jgi:hypothetical protein
MAADYHTEMPHILDFSKYPGVWLAAINLFFSLFFLFCFVLFCFFHVFLHFIPSEKISLSLRLTPGLEERQRFVRIYLSSSGNKT